MRPKGCDERLIVTRVTARGTVIDGALVDQCSYDGDLVRTGRALRVEGGAVLPRHGGRRSPSQSLAGSGAALRSVAVSDREPVTAGGLDDVVAAVRALADRRATALVGIDGPSGSGKSTLAQQVSALSAAPVVEVDDFWTWGDSDQWWDCFVRSVLVPLADGRDARYRARDWLRDEAGVPSGPWTVVPAAPVVVVEGVTCTRRAVQHVYALRVWVDAPPDERRRRGLHRDGAAAAALWEEWIAVESAFFSDDRTASRAELVVGAPHAR